jgi:hypothetical protein
MKSYLESYNLINHYLDETNDTNSLVLLRYFYLSEDKEEKLKINSIY